jgi:hypothetical protein
MNFTALTIGCMGRGRDNFSIATSLYLKDLLNWIMKDFLLLSPSIILLRMSFV